MSRMESNNRMNSGQEHFIPFSVFYKGKYGRMFRRLRSLESWEETHFKKLAESMFNHEDEDESSSIPAGITYLGQFINHDITFDPTSELNKQNDPNRINNFRTPRFDLDSVYSRGPLDSPYLYKDNMDQMNFVVDHIDYFKEEEDVLRRVIMDEEGDLNRSIALVGDPRNDENIILGQLHLAFMKFHNQAVEKIKNSHFKGKTQFSKAERRYLFTQAQKQTRFHYQWLVINEYLEQIVSSTIVNDILRKKQFSVTKSVRIQKGKFEKISQDLIYIDPKFVFYDWKETPFLPVEFSAASFRFGHSMVRPFYILNESITPPKVPIFNNDHREELKEIKKLLSKEERFWRIYNFIDKEFQYKPESIRVSLDIIRKKAGELKKSALNKEAAIQFKDFNAKSLEGFQERPKDWIIDWSLFFQDEGQPADKLQCANKINTRITKSLQKLPFVAENNSLPLRNLRRGMALGLPSGQSIARAMGIPEELILPEVGVEKRLERKGRYVEDIITIPKPLADDLEPGTETPLWYYILKEAEVFMDGECLGPVGGRIVAEVLIGLLVGDPSSYINEKPDWEPQKSIFEDCFDGDFTMADFLRIADGEYSEELDSQDALQ